MGPHQHKPRMGACADGNLKILTTQQSWVKLLRPDTADLGSTAEAEALDPQSVAFQYICSLARGILELACQWGEF